MRGDPADWLTEADLVEKARATLDAVLGRPAVYTWITKAMATFDDALACKLPRGGFRGGGEQQYRRQYRD